MKNVLHKLQKERRKTPNKAQMTLVQTIEHSQCYLKESARKAKLDDALIKMITTDPQPVSMVKDKGFKAFVENLDKYRAVEQ